MSKTQRLGQLWTDSVAYVALLAGAGLSIAGNVANVIRVRGEDLDNLDLVMAVAFPALVVLMVEVFVSARWRGLPAAMQWLRWLGCLSIGVMAMRVSWVHLNELMVSRDQTADVAIIGPLAIDALAIMATALILAGRGQSRPVGRMVFDHPAPIGPMPGAVRVPDSRKAALAAYGMAYSDSGVADEAQSYLDRLADELDTSTTAAYPVSPAPTSNAVKPESVPGDAQIYIATWASADPTERPKATEVDALVAGAQGVSTRTARRWRDAILPKVGA